VYGQSKLEAEIKVREGLTDHVPFVILRPSMVYGPGDRGNFKHLIHSVLKSKFPVPIVDGGRARKNTLYVRNLARVMVHLATHLSEYNGEIFNVADPDFKTMREIIETIANTTGVSLRLIDIPSYLLKPMAIMGDALGWMLGLEMPLSSRKLRVITNNTIVNTAKLYSALSGKIDLFSFEDGLCDFLKMRPVEKSKSG
jgi:nucleoside-diphosphate-sugar epimerase